jgi:hypothetical protein
MSGFGKQDGWGTVNDYSRDGSDNDLGMKRFRMQKGECRRLLFVSAQPFCLYLHDTYKVTGHGDLIVCPEKNGIDRSGCCWCQANQWAAFMGVFTVVDMGLVEREVVNGVNTKVLRPHRGIKDPSKSYQFNKKLLIARRGSKEKPGILIKLKNYSEDHGDSMMGLIYDVRREGELSEGIGNDYQFVEKVAPEDLKKYLIGLGADPAKLSVDEFKYTDEFKPMAHEKMARILQGGKGAAPQGGGAWGQQAGGSAWGQPGSAQGAGGAVGSGYGPADDDNVPF